MPALDAEQDPADTSSDLPRILRKQVSLTVKIAQRRIPFSEIMRWETGAMIEFMKGIDQPLELLLNNKTIGIGEAVKIGENFGLRITQVGDLRQIIRSMGGEQG